MNYYTNLSYRSSPWLLNFPNHWKLTRLDRLFTIRNETPSNNDEIVTAFIDGRVTLRKNVKKEGIKNAILEHGWQHIERGDFAISGMNMHLGGLGVSDSTGKCSPIYLILQPKNYINPFFVSHMIRLAASKNYIKSVLKTIRYNSADFKYSDLKSLYIPVPPLSEQDAIVKFLDGKLADIDKYIAAKQKLISLLHEQKATIINKAVTKGLDPNAKMKDSGVEWLGKVPSEWSIYPTFYYFSEKKEINVGMQEDNVLSLSYGKIVKRNLDENFGLLPLSFETYKIVEPDQLVFRLTDLQNDKRSLRVGLVTEKGLVSSAYLCMALHREGILPQYSYYLFHSYDLVKVFYALGGGTRQSIGFSELKHIPILVPHPKLQRQIVNYIKTIGNKIDTHVSKIKNEIELINQYKSSLIAEAITGKLRIT